jgi:hypothetical protein
MNNMKKEDTHPLGGGTMPDIVSCQELWNWQAPEFNFDFDKKELLEKALKAGFVTKVEGEEDAYLVNNDYKTNIKRGETNE